MSDPSIATLLLCSTLQALGLESLKELYLLLAVTAAAIAAVLGSQYRDYPMETRSLRDKARTLRR